MVHLADIDNVARYLILFFTIVFHIFIPMSGRYNPVDFLPEFNLQFTVNSKIRAE